MAFFIKNEFKKENIYEFQYPDRKVRIASLIFIKEPITLDFELIKEEVEIIKDKIVTAFKTKLQFDACDQPKGCKLCNCKLLRKINKPYYNEYKFCIVV